MTWTGLFFALLPRALARPRLAIALSRLLWRFRARRWYAHPPFLPVPDREYLRWRMYTAYGSHDAVPALDDVIRFALWAASNH